MLALGPLLIVTVFVLVSSETYWALKYLVPAFAPCCGPRWGLHAAWIAFLLFNGMFNYLSCVLTDPGTHTSEVYADLVYEASQRGDIAPSEWEEYAQRHGLPAKRKRLVRWHRFDTRDASADGIMSSSSSGGMNATTTSGGSSGGVASGGPSSSASASSETHHHHHQNGGATTSSGTMGGSQHRVRHAAAAPSSSSSGGRHRAAAASGARRAGPHRGSWIDRGPYEWGFCRYTHGPKAPRAHFDHVTKKLVLNMDHYCPWMFNVVGYANYRYFVLFLVWVALACLYGVAITAFPFLAMANGGATGTAHTLTSLVGVTRAHRPTSKHARSAVMFTFVLALSVGIAVAILGGWHVFLTLTGQTTIEFYGNHTLRQRAKQRGLVFRNPYDRGLVQNWRHVFGPRHPLLAILPSRRPPPGLPWPDDDGPDDPTAAGNSKRIGDDMV
eukprot:CAMPEP_0185716358 /NCGR_PEP_ID=MMETSP1164-20130828/42597_1 /TAXON_ID=1104430 /ORGANISM="Chrysoreinhardia sp, Strain CCMP2950" /LENGTH=441 /DNA_ID=CAMNT_0028383973 /DNA_START=91 /DNA_END=1416 /DNA_ORIENTATION=-